MNFEKLKTKLYQIYDNYLLLIPWGMLPTTMAKIETKGISTYMYIFKMARTRHHQSINRGEKGSASSLLGIFMLWETEQTASNINGRTFIRLSNVDVQSRTNLCALRRRDLGAKPHHHEAPHGICSFRMLNSNFIVSWLCCSAISAVESSGLVGDVLRSFKKPTFVSFSVDELMLQNRQLKRL